jgi:hypothetical protein
MGREPLPLRGTNRASAVRRCKHGRG